MQKEGGSGMESVAKAKKTVWLNVAMAAGITGMIAFVVYGYSLGIFSSREAMEAFLAPMGIWGPLVFILIQIVQVVIPILPGGVSSLAGVLLFGAGWGFVYNYVGLIIGSILAFCLAKRYGRALVQSIASERAYEKYSKWLNTGKRFNWIFAAAIFFPAAPDDLLFYLAGLTNMTLKRFTITMLLAKPFSIALYSMGLLFFAEYLLKMV